MTLLVVDGPNLALRSFYAARNAMQGPDGTQTGDIHLFVASLSQHVRAEKPTSLVVAWDSPGQGFRGRLYPEYKAARRGADRTEQTAFFSLLRHFLDLAGIMQIEIPEYEADDVIAALWKTYRPEAETDKIIILSSDKDLLQLVRPNPHSVVTEQIRFVTGGTDRWTEDRVLRDLGCRPEQLSMKMALSGDQGDGVPGRFGVGPVKALKLLRTALWDLQAVIEADPPSRASVEVSWRLVDLLWNMPVVPTVPLFTPTAQGSEAWDTLMDFCDLYALRLIREHLEKDTAWR